VAELPPLTRTERRIRAVGLGCFSIIIGFMSMAMVATLISAVVARITRAESCADIPSCNWYIYAGVGGVFGAISLPILVLWRLRRPKGAGENR
jgi:hypothetical protein